MKIIVRPSLRLLAFLAGLLCVLTALAGAVPASAASGTTPAAAKLFLSYSASYDNLTYGITSTGSLTNMTVNAAGDVSGYLTVNPPLYGTSELSGKLTGDTLTFSTGAGGDFTSTVNASTGKISGTYDFPSVDQNGTFTATPLKSKLRLAALGDSYSSGEEAGNYYAGTNGPDGCHRSLHAWALQLGERVANHEVTMPSREYFLACSGAVSSALEDSFKGQQPQVDALQHLLPKPTLVTLTMGGNDLGFAEVVKDCYLHNCIKDGTLAAVEAELPAEEKTLARDYIDVHLADPDASLLIVGYPQIFEDASHCGGITTTEEKALNVLTDKVDATIDRATAADKFSYVSDLGALAGHEMCTAHPWLYEIGVWRGLNDDQQQAHPNALGQEAIAKIVAAFIDAHP